MQHLNLLNTLFAILQVISRIHALEITLDGFKHELCERLRFKECRGAYGMFNITGRITLAAGEVMPPFVAYERRCQRRMNCVTYPGYGEHAWEFAYAIRAGDCNYETEDYGCKLQTGRTYRYYLTLPMYWYFRLCTYRARMVDTERPVQYRRPVNEVGLKHVSNELKISEYAKDEKYDTTDDEFFRNSPPCDDPFASTSNGVAAKINPSGTLVIILGSFFTAYLNVFK